MYGQSKCEHCGGKLSSWSYSAKYCKNACRQAAYRQRKATAARELKRNTKKKPTRRVAKRKRRAA